MNLYFGYSASDNDAKMINTELDCTQNNSEHKVSLMVRKLDGIMDRRRKNIGDFSFSQWIFLQKIVDFKING